MKKNYFKRRRRPVNQKKKATRAKYASDFERGFETNPCLKNICNGAVTITKELIRCLVVVLVGSVSLDLLTRANAEIDYWVWLSSIILGLIAFILISYFLKRTKKLDILFYLTKRALKNNFINFQMKRGKCACQK